MFAYLTICIILVFPSKASTAFFSSNDSKIFAKNFDWKAEHGVFFKNLKGQKKYAYGWTKNQPASWTSKYGSITINQFGKEFPIGGMNELGLVVEQLFLPNSIYPKNQGPFISNFEWVQYQLDNHASLAEVLANLNTLSIYPLEAVQFMIADKGGNSAIIAFQDGEATINLLEKKHLIATTEIFTSSEKYANERKLASDEKFDSNLERFSYLNGLLQKVTVDDVDIAFGILQRISSPYEPYKTQWSLVYDLGQLKINFKSAKQPNKKTISLNDFDFSEEGEISIANIHDDNVNFKSYSTDINRFLFQKYQINKNMLLDERLLFEHFSDPGTAKSDLVYQQNHKDLIFKFITKENKGLISFVILKKEGSFPPKYQSVKAGQFLINSKETVKILYGVPIGELSLACFQDPNFSGVLQNNVLGEANDYRFLRTGHTSPGSIPKYYDANLYIKDDTEVIVKIK